MRLFHSVLKCSILILSCISLVISAASSKLPRSITLSYEFINSSPSSVKPLATIFYDPKTLKYNLASWTPPSLDAQNSISAEATSSPLLRILLPNGSSTVTSLSNFDADLKLNIDLWVSADPEAQVFSASVTSLTPPPLTVEEERLQKKIERAKARGKPIPSAPKAKPNKKSKKDQSTPQDKPEDAGPVKVNLIPATPGPAPRLMSRAPPKVDGEGNEIVEQDQQAEKSFFQKYWWVFLLLAVLTMGAGGGEK